MVPQPNIYERRKDLSGVTLINSVLPWEPVMIFDVGRDGIIRNLDGFMYRLYMTLQAASNRDVHTSGLLKPILTFSAQILGFRTRWVLPEDMKWGTQYENGSWNGIMGDLERFVSCVVGIRCKIS